MKLLTTNFQPAESVETAEYIVVTGEGSHSGVYTRYYNGFVKISTLLNISVNRLKALRKIEQETCGTASIYFGERGFSDGIISYVVVPTEEDVEFMQEEFPSAHLDADEWTVGVHIELGETYYESLAENIEAEKACIRNLRRLHRNAIMATSL